MHFTSSDQIDVWIAVERWLRSQYGSSCRRLTRSPQPAFLVDVFSQPLVVSVRSWIGGTSVRVSCKAGLWGPQLERRGDRDEYLDVTFEPDEDDDEDHGGAEDDEDERQGAHLDEETARMLAGWNRTSGLPVWAMDREGELEARHTLIGEHVARRTLALALDAVARAGERLRVALPQKAERGRLSQGLAPRVIDAVAGVAALGFDDAWNQLPLGGLDGEERTFVAAAAGEERVLTARLGRILRAEHGYNVEEEPESGSYRVLRRGHEVRLRVERGSTGLRVEVCACLVRGACLGGAHVDLLRLGGTVVLGGFCVDRADSSIWFRHAFAVAERLKAHEVDVALQCVVSTAVRETSGLAVATGGMCTAPPHSSAG